MKRLIDRGEMINREREIMFKEKQREYVKRFDDSFPMIPLVWGRSEEELESIIDECLEKGKDVYELGYVDDLDIEY